MSTATSTTATTTRGLAQDFRFHSRLFLFHGLLPALLILVDAARGKLGANPVEFVTRATGVLSLVFLVLTLLVTPLRKTLGWNWLVKQRRLLGLYAFFYGLAHLGTYLAFDRDWQLQSVPGDVWQRPFIAVGMIAFALMIPLAVTSTNAMIRRLGSKRWAMVHRLTYLVAIGGVVHYYMIEKSDVRFPLVFGMVVLLLLGWRLRSQPPKAVVAQRKGQ